jgi:hypothetical protein
VTSDQGSRELIVRSEDWPHGLRCGECCRLLRDGDGYGERLSGMVGDFPAYMIVCHSCDQEWHTITAGC